MIHRNHGFTAVEIVLVVLVVGLIAGLGWLYYNRSQNQDTKISQNQAQKNDTENDSKSAVCKEGDSSAREGIFCAEDSGVKLSVPDIFAGKFKRIDNYIVMTQSKLEGESTLFGKSIVAYQAEIPHEKGSLSMTIAKEPLRTFKVRSFMPSLFYKDTQKVTDQNGNEVSSIDIDGHKFYTYGVGDAGTYSDTYTAVVSDSLTVISFTSQEQLGPGTGTGKAFDLDTIKQQFNSRVKDLELL